MAETRHHKALCVFEELASAKRVKGTYDSLRGKHYCKGTNKWTVYSDKINKELLEQIKNDFNALNYDYYAFNYSMYPQGKYGINCWGFNDYVLNRVGLLNYTDVNRSINLLMPMLSVMSGIRTDMFNSYMPMFTPVNWRY